MGYGAFLGSFFPPAKKHSSQISTQEPQIWLRKKPLRIGLIGYGFMGRTHSNAFRKVPNFFDLKYEPQLAAVCARNKDRAEAFAEQWGYESSRD